MQRGYLQGTRDFRRLAANFLIYGGTVVVLSVVLLHLHLGSAAVPVATVGGVLGSSLYPRHPGAHLERAAAAHGHLIDYTVVAGAATAPLFNNVDVVAARHVLPGGSAGLYSGLSVMGKIIFFGTSSLSAVMYPRLAAAATASARRRLLMQTLVALCAADGVALLAYGFFAKPLLRLVLGAQYAPVHRGRDRAHLRQPHGLLRNGHPQPALRDRASHRRTGAHRLAVRVPTPSLRLRSSDRQRPPGPGGLGNGARASWCPAPR